MRLFATVSLLFFVSFVTACTHSASRTESTVPAAQEAPKPSCLLQFQTGDLCGDFSWEVQPKPGKAGTLLVRFSNKATGQTIDPVQSLQVVLWMPSMGHGSSPVAIARVSQGTYRVSNVFFSMPGTWQIKFQFKQGTQLVEEQIATIEF